MSRCKPAVLRVRKSLMPNSNVWKTHGRHVGKFLDCMIIDHDPTLETQTVKIVTKCKMARDLGVTGKTFNVDHHDVWFAPRPNFTKLDNRKEKNTASFTYKVNPLKVEMEPLNDEDEPRVHYKPLGEFLGGRMWRVWNCIRASLVNMPQMTNWTRNRLDKAVERVNGQDWDIPFLRMYANFKIEKYTITYRTMEEIWNNGRKWVEVKKTEDYANLKFECNDRVLASRIKKALGINWTRCMSREDTLDTLSEMAGSFTKSRVNSSTPSLATASHSGSRVPSRFASRSGSVYGSRSPSRSPSVASSVVSIPAYQAVQQPSLRKDVLVALTQTPLKALYNDNSQFQFYKNIGILTTQKNGIWTVSKFDGDVQEANPRLLTQEERKLVLDVKKNLDKFLRQEYQAMGFNAFFGKYRTLISKLAFLGGVKPERVSGISGMELRVEDFNLQSMEMIHCLPKEIANMRLPRVGGRSVFLPYRGNGKIANKCDRMLKAITSHLKELVEYDFNYSLTKPVRKVADLFVTHAREDKDTETINVSFNFRLASHEANGMLGKVIRFGSERLNLSESRTGGFTQRMYTFANRARAVEMNNFQLLNKSNAASVRQSTEIPVFQFGSKGYFQRCQTLGVPL